MGLAYNEFGWNEHPNTTNKRFCNKFIDTSVKKFGYNETHLEQVIGRAFFTRA